MRMSEAKIKEAILHPEKMVRDVALAYFTESFSRDVEVMPIAIEAIETFGRNDAFRFLFGLSELAQTDASVDWLVRELHQPPSTTIKGTNYLDGLSRVLSKADPGILSRRADEIAKAPRFCDAFLPDLRERAEMNAWDAERCWQEISELAEAGARTNGTHERLAARAMNVASALVRHRDVVAERVVELLARDMSNVAADSAYWIEEFAIRIAGELRLSTAVPFLVGKLRSDGDFVLEESVKSLVKIGADAAVEAIGANWQNETWDFKLYATSVLEKIHADATVRRCAELLPVEKDRGLKTNLANALLMQFCDEAIEPVRQMVQQRAYDTTFADLSSDLVAVATAMGVTFPEMAVWKRQAKHHRAEQDRRMRAFDGILASSVPAARKKEKSIGFTLPKKVEASRKTGRNDPCPCGSGKKYKVCCLRK